MLYGKNKSKSLSDKLFKNPTSEYRSTPFWAWNDDLDQKELLWQIEQFKKMGFGGFHMHVRSGLATPYLSDEFMSLIRGCVDKAKKEKMLAWLYDEDRWASGAAGGIVTKNLDFRRKRLIITTKTLLEKTEGTALDSECAGCEAENGNGGEKTTHAGVKLLTAFDVELNPDGTLKSYATLKKGDLPKGKRWNVYLTIEGNSGWFNNQAYIDALSDDAVAEFIRVTHERYYECVGEEFGKVVPAIFTDEPHFAHKNTLPFAESENDVIMPWTYGLNDSFRKKFGYELIPVIPELVWNLAENKPSKTRYNYHDILCDTFTRAFTVQCGRWCEEHGFYLTGHVLDEPRLESQTKVLGEAMRTYKGFGLPGIDMLCNAVELTTAKQAQSAAHQYGREGVLSELYGVTGWEFDFRGHKFQGDWQAALGVTVRVPHLSWYSMKGSAKRDYPAAISYQSAWYKDYAYLEDHFARINTALTRGKPVVNVAVVHPVESYWLEYGPSDATAKRRNQLENDFHSITSWLLRGCIDFDYISEGLLPDQRVSVAGKRLSVGEASYGAVVVPPVTTIRRTTVDALTRLVENGGRVIFTGSCPAIVDAEESDYCRGLYERSEKAELSQNDLLSALSEFREVEIVGRNGVRADNYIYNKRKDGKTEWLFLANLDSCVHEGVVTKENHCEKRDLLITVKGEKIPYVYDTLSGEITPARREYKNGNTVITWEAFASDSLLLRLDEGRELSSANEKKDKAEYGRLTFNRTVDYSLKEDNVLVLDMARWSEDGENYNDREEMLRIDLAIRKKYGYPKADGGDVQPWVIAEQKPEKSVYLKFIINSEIKTKCSLAFEEAEQIFLNGAEVEIKKKGYFVDKRIYVTALPPLKKGENELIVKAPLGKRISLENMFLLGKFGVRVAGAEATVTKLPEGLAFGSVVQQGLPFYGAGVVYKLPFTAEKSGEIEVLAQKYGGALIKATLDGRELGKIAFAPYSLRAEVERGEHLLELELVATRVNTFSALHYCYPKRWKGPGFWYSTGSEWSYEYNLFDTGILKSPEIRFYE